MPNVDPAREVEEHLAGDAPDGPNGVSRVGLFDLTKNAYRVRVRVRSKVADVAEVVYCEVYAPPGEPLLVHWMCPRCGPRNEARMSTINGRNKHVEFDPTRCLEDGGSLNVEPFQCSWELESAGRRMDFGLGLCALKLRIADSVARDA